MNIKWFGNMLVCLSMAGVFSSSQLLGEERGQRRALLIGCTRYDFLRDSQQLYGPANDVELVYDMLTQRFGFPEDNITVLAEERGEKHRPLKAHIQREFEQLIEVAEPGDQVWIHLSGHGTQLLDDGENTNDPDQKDGFDEAFCAADTRAITTGNGTSIPGLIPDDQFHEWLEGIRAKGASAVIVFDSCHSGSAIRGVERTRYIHPGDLMPEATLESAVGSSATRRTATHRAGSTGGPRMRVEDADGQIETGGVVAIYAARDNEQTPEMAFDRESPGDSYYGILTYTLVQVINEAEGPLSYSDWLERVRRNYTMNHRAKPIPFVDGIDRDKEILGSTELIGRTRLVMQTNAAGTMTVSGGDLHGLVEGTVLAVYPPATETGTAEPIGHVRVVAVRTFDSDVEPCEFGETLVSDTPPKTGLCQIVAPGIGVKYVRVAVSGESRRLKLLRDQLAQITEEPDCLFELVRDPAEADFVVNADGKEIYLDPVSGRAAGLVPQDSVFAVIPLKESKDWLRKSLKKIARAMSLVQIASQVEDGQSSGRGSEQTRIEVQVSKVDLRGSSLEEIDLTQTRPSPAQRGELAALPAQPLENREVIQQVRDREAVRLVWRNTGTQAVDVTVLYVDSTFGISPMFGRRKNRLEPGEESEPLLMAIRTDMNGLERVLVMATGVTGPHSDLTWLAQPSEVRVPGNRSGEAMSAIEAMFVDRLNQKPTSRGTSLQPGAAAFAVISWETLFAE